MRIKTKNRFLVECPEADGNDRKCRYFAEFSDLGHFHLFLLLELSSNTIVGYSLLPERFFIGDVIKTIKGVVLPIVPQNTSIIHHNSDPFFRKKTITRFLNKKQIELNSSYDLSSLPRILNKNLKNNILQVMRIHLGVNIEGKMTFGKMLKVFTVADFENCIKQIIQSKKKISRRTSLIIEPYYQATGLQTS